MARPLALPTMEQILRALESLANRTDPSLDAPALIKAWDIETSNDPILLGHLAREHVNEEVRAAALRRIEQLPDIIPVYFRCAACEGDITSDGVHYIGKDDVAMLRRLTTSRGSRNACSFDCAIRLLDSDYRSNDRDRPPTT